MVKDDWTPGMTDEDLHMVKDRIPGYDRWAFTRILKFWFSLNMVKDDWTPGMKDEDLT